MGSVAHIDMSEKGLALSLRDSNAASRLTVGKRGFAPFWLLEKGWVFGGTVAIIRKNVGNTRGWGLVGRVNDWHGEGVFNV